MEPFTDNTDIQNTCIYEHLSPSARPISIMKFFLKNKFENLGFIHTTTKSSTKIFIKELLSSLALLLLIVTYPVTVHAGFFSFLESVSADKASANVSAVQEQTSQNMLVLTAAVNIDPLHSASDTSAYTVVSGNSLAADIGPTGTTTDTSASLNTQISTYVVRSGDSLSSIAKIFNVSVNTIVWANDLSRNEPLAVGQTLVILPISGINHVIKKGETISGIVKRYGADQDEVLKYNDITVSTVLVPGNTIIIPDGEMGVSTIPNRASGNTSTSGTRGGHGVPPRSQWGKPNSNPVHDANGPYYPGYFVRPIDGGYKSQGLHGHNAVDLADDAGTPIHAAADGVVIVKKVGGWNGGYGNYVVISHPNGTETLYAHASKVLVSVGDHVNQGQTIELMGQTGEATGPHLHFEIWSARNPF